MVVAVERALGGGHPRLRDGPLRDGLRILVVSDVDLPRAHPQDHISSVLRLDHDRPAPRDDHPERAAVLDPEDDVLDHVVVGSLRRRRCGRAPERRDDDEPGVRVPVRRDDHHLVAGGERRVEAESLPRVGRPDPRRGDEPGGEELEVGEHPVRRVDGELLPGGETHPGAGVDAGARHRSSDGGDVDGLVVRPANLRRRLRDAGWHADLRYTSR